MSSIKPNQVVVALTPVVFAPLAGAISVLAAKYFPGVKIDTGSLTSIFIAGATIALAKAGLWLKGWQEYEKRQAENEPDLVTDPDFAGDLDADIGDAVEPVIAGAAG